MAYPYVLGHIASHFGLPPVKQPRDRQLATPSAVKRSKFFFKKLSENAHQTGNRNYAGYKFFNNIKCDSNNFSLGTPTTSTPYPHLTLILHFRSGWDAEHPRIQGRSRRV